jgi:nucleoid-associated protein YgaU
MAARAQGLDTRYDRGVMLAFPTATIRRRAAARRRAMALRRAGVASTLAATCILALMGSGGGTAQASHPSSAPTAVVVRSGQTVWDLAHRYAPASTDPRVYVDRVLALNHLSGPPAAGVRLRLPR